MILTDETTVVLRLAVAGLGGLAVGIEREWSGKLPGGTRRFAGVRTFLLLGLIGGLAAEFHGRGQVGAGVVLLAAAGALIVVAFALRLYRGDVAGTTEVSALLVLGAGFLAGTGLLKLASGLFAITALALVEKSLIHSLVYRIQSETLEAAARFAVLALVVLPLLPAGPFGPAPGFRPRELWALVLVFSALSFAGYIALRLAEPRTGYRLAGLLGGLISSTAVTLHFSRDSRAPRALGGALAVGVIAACTLLLVRVAILAGVLNPPVGVGSIPYLWIPFAVGLVAIAIASRWREPDVTQPALPRNPLRLVAAIYLAIAFQVVLYLVAWVRGRFGSSGILVSAALIGLTEMDALTYSMVKIGQDAAQTAIASRALGVGVLANTLLKLAMVFALGRGSFRRVAGVGLSALAVGSAVALIIR